MIPSILAAVDFTDHSGRALRVASELSGALGAKLSVLHVQLPAQLEDARGPLEDFYRTWAHPDLAVELHSVRPSAIDITLAWIAEHKPALLVCGSHDDHHVGRSLLGSVSSKLLGKAPLPVLVVRGELAGKILVASDASPDSVPALRLAGFLARSLERELDVLHVLPRLGVRKEGPDDAAFLAEREKAREALDALLAAEKLQARKLVEAGDRVRKVVEVAGSGDYGLLITAGHRRTGMSRTMMGSVTEEIDRLCPCSLLSVPTA